MDKKKEYEITCYGCGATKNLCMVAHRKEGLVVGWIFTCEKCFEQVKGLTLVVSK